jgi:hypothetical protein
MKTLDLIKISLIIDIFTYNIYILEEVRQEKNRKKIEETMLLNMFKKG